MGGMGPKVNAWGVICGTGGSGVGIGNSVDEKNFKCLNVRNTI
jgi:hypothetical protein